MTEIHTDATEELAPDPDVASTVAASAGTRGRFLTGLPLWLFGALVAVAFPILLFDLGRYHWFMRDEWIFFVERRSLSMSSLFEPFNVHPVAVPVAGYRALWNVFGLESYRPYQAVVIVLHLAAAVLLRVIMRRSGVRPWLATVCAGAFVFFGPGAQNILWAFQIGFTGALVFGLVQLVAADHDGPFDRRDLLGAGAGVLSVMSTGTGITMALVAGLGILGRRGWKIAFLHCAPSAAVYGAWYAIQDPATTTTFGRPTPSALVDWVASGVTGTFTAVAQNRLVAVALAIVLIAGVALAWSPVVRRRSMVRRETVQRLAIPTALLIGSVLFMSMTGWTRFFLGPEGARASRYLHLGLALTLPALAVGAEELARRWRWTVPAVALLLLSAVPANIDAFEPTYFGPSYMDERRRILTTAVRMPFARDVSPDVRPVPDPYDGELTIGFLLDAYDAGQLPAYSWEISTQVENEMRIRLGLLQRITGMFPLGCRQVSEAVEVHLDRGDQLVIGAPVNISTTDGERTTSSAVTFNQALGTELTAELDDLDLRLEPVPGSPTLTLCDQA